MACSSINTAVNKINAPVRYLTKSLVRTALKCPRKLVYASNPTLYPKRKSHTEDPLLQHLSLEGERFGDYCKQLFPHGVEIGVTDGVKLKNHHKNDTTLSTSHEHASLDHLVAQTHRTLMGGQEEEHDKRVTVFEGAIQHGLFYVRPDILDKIYDKESAQIELRVIEVKSKSWDSRYTIEEKMWTQKKGIRSGYLPYIQDIAFQTMVCRLVYPDVKISSWLMMPDRAKKSNNPPILNEDEEDTIPTLEDTIQSIDDSIASLLNVDELVETALLSEVSYPGSKKGETFIDTVLRWAEKLNDDNFCLDSFSSPIGMQCSSCEYRVKDPPENIYSGFDICWQEATGLALDELQNNPLVVDIHANTNKSLKGFISEGKYKISDLTKKDFDLVNGSGTINRSQRQWYQVETIKSTPKNNTNLVHPNYIIQRNHMKQIMEKWKYPFHFIDFETMSPTIPYHPNMSPYEVFAFQFSHHTMTKNHDGEFQVTHASEFLHTDTETGSPNIAFLKALYNALCTNGDVGTVFQWSPHETTVLKAMLESPEAIAALSAKEMSSLSAILSEGMVDLCKLAQQTYYVDGSEGSSSIKRLLKPTLNASSHLKSIYGSSTYNSANFSNFQWYQLDDDGCAKDPYDIMGNPDQHDSATITMGMAAATAYHKLQNDVDLNEADRKDIETSLLRYCELDTLAMVMILQAWQGFLNDDK